MIDTRKTLYFDANDILFSTQYIYLYNLNRFKEYDDFLKNSINSILSKCLQKDRSFFQSIVHRSIESIVTYDDFSDIMNYVVSLPNISEDAKQIKLDSMYSKFFLNLHKLSIETDIAVLYKNNVEKTLLEHRVKELDKCNLYSRDEIYHILDNGSKNKNDIGLFTSDTILIEKYKDSGFDIMVPDECVFLFKQKKYNNVFPMKALWNHVQ